MVVQLVNFSLYSLTITVALAIVCLYLWSLTTCHYWKVRGVPYLKPVFPIFGNMYDIVFLKDLVYMTDRIYRQTKDFYFMGIYAFRTPVLFVRDLNVILNILVKDFHHFEDRGFNANASDSLGRNLLHQSGPDWKFSRTKLAPCFNMSKVKSMVPTMVDKSKVLVEKIQKDQEANETIEMWDTSLRYSTDVVTLCTIGIDANSLINDKEHFREAGSHMLGIHFIYHVFTGCFLRGLHQFLSTSVAKARVTKFFHGIINQAIKYRRVNGLANKDVLHTLLKLKEEPSVLDKNIPEVDDNFVVAQSFIFFLTGFETPGNILACTLFEIAKHPQIQESLCAEISEVLKIHEGVTFEALQDMKYMMQVISEALRKYTPVALNFRRCTKDYMIRGTSVIIEKGTLIMIPMRNIHMDPKYYPDPDVFDPERFSDKSCAANHPAAFIPFGIGPRFCPAVLYSCMKIKAALIHILQQYEVCVTEKTPPKLEPSTVDFLFAPKDGVPLAFRRRGT